MFYILILDFFKAKIIYILQNQDYITYLIANLQQETIYRLIFFLIW